ncbi:MAG: class I SAM-dependent rRNA methyltransferase [Zetaproteobacteria bacterium]|nr:MAG: class I SAM-dependent rRNA methyltransferase [Zetaproteobacteria bacterium]
MTPGRLVLKPHEERALKRGRLWIYDNEIGSLHVDGPGGLVHVYSAAGTPIGTAYAHPDNVIAARLISKSLLRELKPKWWEERLAEAARWREELVGGEHWRWVHGEGDRLPGLVVDRYGDQIVVQAHTAGIDRELDKILDAIERIARPRAIFAHHRIPGREKEGLPLENKRLRGEGDGELVAKEHGLVFRCHALFGQKTGYFYDQRTNRRWIRGIARGKRVLDAFSYVGGFALHALAGGAKEAVALDVSARALGYARANAEANGLSARFSAHQADAMEALAAMAAERTRFDLVVCDPPAFAKHKSQLSKALYGYQKLARLAAQVVAPGGMLAIASCSAVVPIEMFRRAVLKGVREAGRSASVVYQGGQAEDHPWPLAMPELAYLKFLGLVLHG